MTTEEEKKDRGPSDLQPRSAVAVGFESHKSIRKE